MTTIKKGEKIFDKDGNLFATVAKDIRTGDKIISDCFDFVDPSVSTPGKLWPIEIREFLNKKHNELNNQR